MNAWSPINEIRHFRLSAGTCSFLPKRKIFLILTPTPLLLISRSDSVHCLTNKRFTSATKGAFGSLCI